MDVVFIEERVGDFLSLQEFFNSFKEHCQNINETEYLEYIFNIFYPKFFNKMADLKRSEIIWERHFPVAWKITKENWENNENLIKISWENYRIWLLIEFGVFKVK